MAMSPTTKVHLRVSVEARQGSRKTMEDYTAVTIEKQHDSEAFFAVFDGHGGYNAALFARQNLWVTIRKQKDFYSSDPEKVCKAIKDGFVEIHEAMWKERDSWPKTKHGSASTAGTTASVVILRGRHMFVANVGDSRVVLARKEGDHLKATALTADHKPNDGQEKERIESIGGEIGRSSGVFRVAWNRVCKESLHHGPVLRSTKMESVPFLAIARSLGDLWSFNSYTGQYIVSPVPDVKHYVIDPAKEKFVVLASDGLWNIMKNKEVVRFIDHVEKNTLGLDWQDDVAHRLTCRALCRWSERHLRADNTTVIVVFFDEEERTQSSLYGSYSPPSDAETEMTETTPDLSRTNSFTSQNDTKDGELPKLVRTFGFYGDSLRKQKRQSSPEELPKVIASCGNKICLQLVTDKKPGHIEGYGEDGEPMKYMGTFRWFNRDDDEPWRKKTKKPSEQGSTKDGESTKLVRTSGFYSETSRKKKTPQKRARSLSGEEKSCKKLALDKSA